MRGPGRSWAASAAWMRRSRRIACLLLVLTPEKSLTEKLAPKLHKEHE